MEHIINRPLGHEHSTRYDKLIAGIPANSPEEALLWDLEEGEGFIKSIPAEKWNFRYAEGKWTPREIYMHLIDSERIFIYRALSVARGETLSLPGFEEDEYAVHYANDLRTPEELWEEFAAVRKTYISLFRGISAEAQQRVGKANNSPLSARAAAFISAGHHWHHRNVIRERYL